MKRRFWLALSGVVLCLACLPLSCAKQNGAADRGRVADCVRAAYEAVAAIDPTARADAAYADYARRVSDASAAVTACKPAEGGDRAIVSHLSAALYAYQNAARAWETKTAECEDCAWRKFRDSHPLLALPPGADADYAMKLLWSTASGELRAAREGLDARTER
ncbi:MAG: hypothetical protein PHU43_05620 [Candidatus Bipolaricaulis sp.]|nr:hypothetical protein [Candidatus Bipolaricaulis sp.]